MKKLLIIVLLSSSVWASDLQHQLETMAAMHRGKVALYAHNLKTGVSVAVDADRPVKTASVIKLPIMLEVFEQVKAGKRSLNDKVVLRQEDKVAGSGVLPFLHSGLELTLDDAVTLMMIVSDNTATNLVLDQIGIPAVNARLASMGLKSTYLYKKVYKPPEGPMPPDQKKFGLGKTTGREMAAVMESIARCDLGAPQLCRRMIEIMKNQQDRQMIPRLIEAADTSETESAIADKIGELDDSRNDVALIESQAGPIVISAFTYENQDQRWNPDNEAYLLIARMAKAIVDAWSPGGLKTGHN
ncbi:MAG TPA: serine hydrolase [Terriglobales bacterium]|nr:serine hydrolase [Terriglobales bacterium]